MEQIVVLTGGNSGIGLAIAKALAAQDVILHLIARTASTLDQVKQDLVNQYGSKVHTHAQDIGERDSYVQLIKEIGDRHGRIDLLINNAGISHADYFQNLPLEAYENAIQINYLGAVYGTYAAWPFLQKGNNPTVVFVSSVAGYLGIIGYPSYVPSKFALTGLAETLRMEGKACGIQVSILFPPDTETPMLYQDSKNIPPETEALGSAANLMQPEQVATLLLQGIRKGKFEIYGNLESKLYRTIKGLVPGLFYRIIDQIAARARRKGINRKTVD